MNNFNDGQYAWILGQDPDSFIGDFNAYQALRGKLLEFNIWNYTIEKSLMNNMANCTELKKGNIVAWTLDKIKTYGQNAPQISIAKVCLPPKKIILIAEKLYIQAAKTFCRVHGGYMFTPTIITENDQMKELLNQNKKACSMGSGYSAWLGIEKHSNSTWMNQKDGKIIDFNMFEKGEQLNPHPIFTHRGTWKTKIAMELQGHCFICGFTKEPVYSLKGPIHKQAYSYNYYMENINSELVYSGYKGGSIRINSTNWQLNAFRGIKYRGHLGKEIHPLGRKLWFVKNNEFPQNNGETFLAVSKCIMLAEFTCNSGLCVREDTHKKSFFFLVVVPLRV